MDSKIRKLDTVRERTDGETILIVEDEEVVRNVVARILKSLGYKVLIASNGIEAIDIFKTTKEHIHLVLMDVVMPQMSGPQVYKKLCSLNAELPVIFVTGYDVQGKIPEFDELIQSSRATALQKPYSKEVLGQKVREALQR